MLAISRKDTPGTVIWSRPEEAAFRRFYYSQPLADGSKDNNALEDLFSTVESEWPSTATALESRAPANHVIGNLAAFMGLQRVRVPAFRDAVELSMQRFVETGFKHLRAVGGLPSTPAAFPDLADQVRFAIDPHQSIHAMARLLPSLNAELAQLGYQVLHNVTEVDLIASDNPACYYDPGDSDHDLRPYPVAAGPHTELLLPISPKTIIHGSAADRPRYGQRGLKHVTVKDPERIRGFNRIIARFAYHAIISRNALPVSFVQRHAEHSPVVDPAFPGFDPDHVQLPPYVFGERRRLPKYDQ